MSDYGYVVYIDEAGDFGLRKVAPLDERGASEWFVMGAAVVRKENEQNVPRWLRSIREEAKNTQPIDLHFRTLNDRQKRIVCDRTANLKMRLFVVISNKQNMRGYTNRQAAQVSKHKHWFYWWCTRLLLERITTFCATRNAIENSPGRKLRMEFSRRRDLRKSDLTDYLTRIWAQGKQAHLNKRTIDWSIIDHKDIHFFDHRSRAGLQFADVVASSFFQALNTIPSGTCSPGYAKILEPRMHRIRQNQIFDEGVTVWPPSFHEIDLCQDQIDFLRFYGMPPHRMRK